MSQIIIKSKYEVIQEKKKKQKIAIFNTARFKSWANVLGIMGLAGLIFLASLFI